MEQFAKRIRSYATSKIIADEYAVSLAKENKEFNMEEMEHKIIHHVSDPHQKRIPGAPWNNYSFFKFKFPWPYQDRWVIYQNQFDETLAVNGIYTVKYHKVLGSFRELKGELLIQPHPTRAGWSEIKGKYFVDPDIEAPRFVIRSTAEKNFKRDLLDIRKWIRSLQ